MSGTERNNFIEFTVKGAPVGKARPRVTTRGGYARAYTPKQTADYEKAVVGAYRAAYGNLMLPEKTELHAKVEMYYPIPVSVSKKNRLRMIAGEVRPIVKPDIDNVLKAVLDACNGVAYKDDNLIVSVTADKWYSEVPRVVVRVWSEVSDA